MSAAATDIESREPRKHPADLFIAYGSTWSDYVATELIQLSFFKDRRAKKLTTKRMRLSELSDLIRTTGAEKKEKLPWLKLGIFGDRRSSKGSLRHDDNVEAITGAEGDYDGGAVSFAEAVSKIRSARLCAILYTSPSHRDDAPKWRVLVFTSKELPPDQRVALMARVNGVLGGILESESFTLSQSYYYGSVCGNPAHEAVVIEGDFVDLRADLDAGAIWKARPADNLYAAYGDVHGKQIVDIERRLDEMSYRGSEAAIHNTQLSVAAAMLTRGHDTDEVVEKLIEATRRAAGAEGDTWDWNEEERAIRRMCTDWLRKHPEVGGERDVRPAADRRKRSNLVRASDIVMRPKDWLWRGHLLRGAQELLTGIPGLGKSQVQISFVACATTGSAWPDGAAGREPLNVIMLTAEDALDQEVLPRLIAAGADTDRVHILRSIKRDRSEGQFLLGEDLDELERVVARVGSVGLITIDPITAYMGGKMDSHKTTEVRAQLGPLKDFAERTNIAVSTITHPPKSTSQKAIDHFIGSQAFIAAARIGHLCVQEFEENEEGATVPTGRVLFAHAKHNPSVKMPTLAFRISEVVVRQDMELGVITAPRVIWETGSVGITADEAVASAARGGKVDPKVKVRAFLEEITRDGPVPKKRVEEEAERRGITPKQLRTARERLGFATVRDGTVWNLRPRIIGGSESDDDPPG